jgi:hypothetical protein
MPGKNSDYPYVREEEYRAYLVGQGFTGRELGVRDGRVMLAFEDPAGRFRIKADELAEFRGGPAT